MFDSSTGAFHDFSPLRFARNTRIGILSAAGNNVPNLPAVKLLQTVCPKEKHDYVFTGSKAKNLTKALPGVSVTVLGPPTLNGPSSATSTRSGSRQRHSRSCRAPPRTKQAANSSSVAESRRVSRARRVGSSSVWIEIVASRPSNSFEPRTPCSTELAQTDVYKVSHHGSLNATPKASLWAEFKKAGGAGKKGRIQTVMSTATGYFGGKGGAETEVPRKALVKELKAKSKYHATDAPRKKGEMTVRVDVSI